MFTEGELNPRPPPRIGKVLLISSAEYYHHFSQKRLVGLLWWISRSIIFVETDVSGLLPGINLHPPPASLLPCQRIQWEKKYAA